MCNTEAQPEADTLLNYTSNVTAILTFDGFQSPRSGRGVRTSMGADMVCNASILRISYTAKNRATLTRALSFTLTDLSLSPHTLTFFPSRPGRFSDTVCPRIPRSGSPLASSQVHANTHTRKLLRTQSQSTSNSDFYSTPHIWIIHSGEVTSRSRQHAHFKERKSLMIIFRPTMQPATSAACCARLNTHFAPWPQPTSGVSGTSAQLPTCFFQQRYSHLDLLFCW